MERGPTAARTVAPDKSQASGLVRRLQERGEEARQITEHLDYILTRLRGPMPSGESPAGPKSDRNVSPGLFRAIEEVDDELATAHGDAIKITQQILDALEL